MNQGENVVAQLSRRYNGSGRTIVADNFFTSLNLCEKLIDASLSYVGTVRKSKRFIPLDFLPKKGRECEQLLSTKFGFYSNDKDQRATLCSYVPKKKKRVVLLSTMHYNEEVLGPLKKPMLIHYYNEFKCGVDVMDQMVTSYSCKRKTRRWPLAFFFNIVDLAALATYVVYTDLNPNGSKMTDTRRKMLHSLAVNLIQAQLQERMNNLFVMRHQNVRNAIELLYGGQIEKKKVEAGPSPGPKQVQGCCKICLTQDKLRRKSRQMCCSCLSPVCAVHSTQYVQCKECETAQ